MRVLWVCNIMLPFIAKELQVETSNKEGWLTGLAEKLIESKQQNKITLGISFPITNNQKECNGEIKGVSFYGFQEEIAQAETYDATLELRLKYIVDEFKPDILHVFGTEYAHSLAAIKAFHKPEKTLVGIQGLCSEIAKTYMADLPLNIQKRSTFRDFIKKDSIEQQQQKFYLRGEREKEIIKHANHITGRTEFDKRVTSEINPQGKYHFMNETLRSNFYQNKWQIESCKPYQIFISQGDYPLKGLHYLIKALPFLKKKYSQVRIVVAGDKVIKENTIKEKIKLSSYGKYLRDLITEQKVEDELIFLGRQNADEMKQTYLESNVYICASIMDNSPNTVGEAMLLGMPVIATKVGGIPSLLEDGKEGLLYTHNNIDELVACVDKIFADKEYAVKLGNNAQKRGEITHDATSNYQSLIDIYRDINLRVGEV